MDGWRLHWLTRPVPRDPEPGASSNAMTGACLTVSQVQSIPWSAAPSSTWLLLVTSAFVTPIVTRGNAAKPYAIRAAAVIEVPVSFQKKETGTGWRKIRHIGSDRTSCRMRIVLGLTTAVAAWPFRFRAIFCYLGSTCDFRSTPVGSIRLARQFPGFSACG